MSPEKTLELVKKYPKIFADPKDPTKPNLTWGFEHGDGWYWIIDSLGHCIQSHIDWTEKQAAEAKKYNAMVDACAKGDWKLFYEYYASFESNKTFLESRMKDVMKDGKRMTADPAPQVVASQVKEKFGTLRFYHSGGDDAIAGMIRMAEEMSGTTCEECGKPGTTTQGGWIRTLCKTHKRKKA